MSGRRLMLSYTVLTKAKLCAVYVRISGEVQTSVAWVEANQLRGGQAGTVAFVC